jgi:hypothetical protein
MRRNAALALRARADQRRVHRRRARRAAIVAAVVAGGVAGAVVAGIERAICEAAQHDDCGTPGRAGDRADEQTAAGAGDRADRRGDPTRPEAAAAAEPGPGFGPTSTGSPPDVPGARAPPPPPPGDVDGSGEFDSVDPGPLGDVQNDAFEELAYRGADLFETLGREDAARHLRHFLGASGDPLDVDPARMLRDIEFFRESEHVERDRMIRDIQAEAARRYNGQPFSFTVGDRGWTGVPSDPDILGSNWFYALGGFSFTHTASVRVSPPTEPGGRPQVEIDYRTHVFDRYNWDKGKSVDIGPLHVSDEELQDLHRAGLAQDFDVHGSSETQTVKVDADPDASAGAPPSDPPEPTPPAGDDEGGRRDPGRERGEDDRRDPSDRGRDGRGGR